SRRRHTRSYGDWSSDVCSSDLLLTINHDGKKIDAVAQITKHGYVFLFDRTNGKSIFPVKEILVPANGLPGEEIWPTQPIPSLPRSEERRVGKECRSLWSQYD